MDNLQAEKHYADLNDMQDQLADAQQMFDWHMTGLQKGIEKLRKIHAEIRQRIGQIDLQISRD